jgi:hypothetical protein
MAQRYETGLPWPEQLAEAKRALADPDLPEDLRTRLAEAIRNAEATEAEMIAFFRAVSVGMDELDDREDY